MDDTTIKIIFLIKVKLLEVKLGEAIPSSLSIRLGKLFHIILCVWCDMFTQQPFWRYDDMMKLCRT